MLIFSLDAALSSGRGAVTQMLVTQNASKWLLSGSLEQTLPDSRGTMGAICPFIDLHPQVDRETLFFFKYLGALPDGNAI